MLQGFDFELPSVIPTPSTLLCFLAKACSAASSRKGTAALNGKKHLDPSLIIRWVGRPQTFRPGLFILKLCNGQLHHSGACKLKPTEMMETYLETNCQWLDSTVTVVLIRIRLEFLGSTRNYEPFPNWWFIIFHIIIDGTFSCCQYCSNEHIPTCGILEGRILKAKFSRHAQARRQLPLWQHVGLCHTTPRMTHDETGLR